MPEMQKRSRIHRSLGLILKSISETKKITIAGIGSRIRSDDSAGVIVADNLKNKLSANVVICEDSPESYIKPILNSNSDVVIVIDAVVDEQYLPGDIFLVNLHKIHMPDISTHKLSLLHFINEIKAKSKVIFIAIKPKKLDFGEELSPEVKGAVKILTDLFLKYLRN